MTYRGLTIKWVNTEYWAYDGGDVVAKAGSRAAVERAIDRYLRGR